MDYSIEDNALDETPILCGLTADIPISPLDSRNLVIEQVRKKFPACQDIFSDDGVTLKDLPFCMHRDKWYFVKDNERNSVSIKCP